MVLLKCNFRPLLPATAALALVLVVVLAASTPAVAEEEAPELYPEVSGELSGDLSDDDAPPPGTGGPVTVTSEKMEVTGGGSLITFTGDVMARDDFLLCSDLLEIDKSGEGGDVTEITATGRVRFVMEGKRGSSERAVYNRDERTIVLTGSAEVGQCSDKILGDKITFYLDDGRSVVEGATNNGIGNGVGNGTGSGTGRVKAIINPDGGGDCMEMIEDEEDFCRGAR